MNSRKQLDYLAIGLVVGTGIEAVMDIALNNLAVGIPLGFAIATFIGFNEPEPAENP